MRFLKDGPSIPDDLLFARDEGRVIFFCGAGVSRARAKMPDFFGLADDVIKRLRVAADHPACKVLVAAREMEKSTGVSGLISADRVFGLLERDFPTRDVEAAVAQALRPADDVDLSAHRIMLNLATTREGKVRLVTTNFERLFEDCSSKLTTWRPPRLPDPLRPNEMDGITHLHGCATPDYSGAEGDGFVLSSAAFGRAYLSDGWATEFFRNILARYVVVFIGYTADDPPVQYLLEALKEVKSPHGIYAFQSGMESEVIGKWRHKGVDAIPYSDSEGHRALWETLSAWAERAKAPDEWLKSVIEKAKQGPELLEPHERGQVAHIISSVEGARMFADADPPPPAEWLCVFDPLRRYSTPSRTGRLNEDEPFVDPFDLYGLDCDTVPPRISSEERFKKRDVPSSAWDGLAANRLDKQSLRDWNFPSIRGHWASHFPRVPSRLDQLRVWIGRVADQPASVWWAAHQSGLHPDLQEQILWQLRNSQKEISPIVRQAWRYLFEAWATNEEVIKRDLYDLEQNAKRDGWKNSAIREYAVLTRPYLKAGPSYWGGPIPPSSGADIRIEDMMRLEIAYSNTRDQANVPDEWLSLLVRELRKNLEHALQLEQETGGYRLFNLSPIVPDAGVNDVDYYARTEGLSGSVIQFASLFERLLRLDSAEALKEFRAWLAKGDTIFTRLRIWAAGFSELVPSGSFVEIITEMSDVDFWSQGHQRDLLFTLSKRWDELPELARRQIESRLLRGRSKRVNEEDTEFEKRRAWATLNRLAWLAKNGCRFTFDLTAETQRLQSIVPGWNQEDASRAAESMEPRGGWVRTETEHSALLNEPVYRILDKARELSGRTDFLTEMDPFAGLCVERPVRAFSALIDAARQDHYPDWAWRTFLNQTSKNDNTRFCALVAERLSRFPNEAIATFVRPASDWLLDQSEHLATRFQSTFDRIMSKLIDVLRSQPIEEANSDKTQRDWTMAAINSPAGKIAEALFKDPRQSGLNVDEGFPGDWLKHANDLLTLIGDARCHVLVIFAHNLDWFYAIDSRWTENNLLTVLDYDSISDRRAIWSGFFWGGRLPRPKLYMRLKPRLLSFAKEPGWPRNQHYQMLAFLILAGWGNTNISTSEPFVSDDEMHDVLLHGDDELRAQVLWLIGTRSRDENAETRERWNARTLYLLRDVWPRQKAVRTPKISGALCDLAFSNVDHFPEITDAILPLLTAIERNRFMSYDPLEPENNVIDKYPESVLAILNAILPDDVAAWPYGVGEALHRIGEADANLVTDERLLELNRRWNSR
jgi:hypothetical protein